MSSAPSHPSPAARCRCGRRRPLGGTPPRPTRPGSAGWLALRAGHLGASGLCDLLCGRDGSLPARLSVRGGRRRAVRPGLGRDPQPSWRHHRRGHRLSRRALPRRGLGGAKGGRSPEAADRRRGSRRLAVRRLCPTRTAVPLQPDELRARSDAHRVPAVSGHLVRLHGARSDRLYLARPCRPRGPGWRHLGDPLRPAGARAARRDRLPAPAVRCFPLKRGRLDRAGTAAPADRGRRSTDRARRTRRGRILGRARAYPGRAEHPPRRARPAAGRPALDLGPKVRRRLPYRQALRLGSGDPAGGGLRRRVRAARWHGALERIALQGRPGHLGQDNTRRRA